MNNIPVLIASFTRPISIGATPASLLWIFPLLLCVAVIYKATKMRVLFTSKFIKEVSILFLTLSLVMTGAAVALNIIVWIVTS
jgi:predicted nuclease of restriction endonuclease-like RecB superfamily